LCSSLGPKALTEAPPPSYEEALDRQAVRHAEQEEVTGADLARDEQDNNTINAEGVSGEPIEDLEEFLEPGITNTD
jgi:hypothetical protein